MSYYTVNTTNAFAALDLSDDGEKILPQTLAPKKVEEEPAAPAPAKKESAKGARGQGRGRRNDNRPRDSAVAAQDGEDTGAAERNTRGRGRPTHARRGGRGDAHPAREGKRTFDRKSATKKVGEDTNPEHEAQDEVAAEEIATQEAVAEVSEPETKTEVREPVPERFTVEQFLAQQEAERVQKQAAAAAPVETYNDLNREIADAGFKPLDNKKEALGGRVPGASKANAKPSKARGAQDLFATVGHVPQMPGTERRDERRRNRDNRDNRSSQSAPKKVVRDEAEYPALE